MKDHFFSNLKDLKNDMLKILGEVSTITAPFTLAHTDDKWQPRYDMFETDNKLVIIFELAGVEKGDISLTSTEKYLRLTGFRNIDIGSDNAYYHALEIETGKFDKKIFFPEIHIDYAAPITLFKNGLLRIEYNILSFKEKIIEINVE